MELSQARERIADLEGSQERAAQEMKRLEDSQTHLEKKHAEALDRAGNERDDAVRQRKDAEEWARSLQQRLDAATAQARALHGEAQRAQMELASDQARNSAKLGKLEERLSEAMAKLENSESDKAELQKAYERCMKRAEVAEIHK